MFLYDLADAIFGPLQSLLRTVLDWLQNVSLVAAQGIHPEYYLGPVAWMGDAWLSLVKRIILGCAVFGVVLVARAGYGLYLDFKAGVKWW